MHTHLTKLSYVHFEFPNPTNHTFCTLRPQSSKNWKLKGRPRDQRGFNTRALLRTPVVTYTVPLPFKVNLNSSIFWITKGRPREQRGSSDSAPSEIQLTVHTLMYLKSFYKVPWDFQFLTRALPG